MSDVGDRADDYERRLADAGGPDAMIDGLVKGLARQRRVSRWLAVSIILDIVLSIFLGALALVAWRNSDAIEHQADVACHQSAQNSIVVNTVLEQLIENVEISTTLTPAEKDQRVTDYEALLINIPDC